MTLGTLLGTMVLNLRSLDGFLDEKKLGIIDGIELGVKDGYPHSSNDGYSDFIPDVTAKQLLLGILPCYF